MESWSGVRWGCVARPMKLSICYAASEAAVHISHTRKILIDSHVCMPCDTWLYRDTFYTSSFAHESSLFFVILDFLEMVFLGSLPTILGAEAQQSLSVDKLVWNIVTQVSRRRVVEERQRKRKQELRNACRNEPKSPHYKSYLSHLIVDDAHRLVYCYVPKVACTTWKKIMATLNGFPNQTAAAVHRRDQNRLKYLAEYSQAKIKTILQSYFKFIFVREPFERLLSAYKDKFIKGDEYILNKYGREIVGLRQDAKWDARTRIANITFGEFVNYLIYLQKKQGRFNEHWRTYEALCRPCIVNYHFIGHYETMAEDARYLLKRAGVEHLVNFPSFHTTDTAHELLAYYSQIPQRDLVEIQKIYQRDFNMFGYERVPSALTNLFRLGWGWLLLFSNKNALRSTGLVEGMKPPFYQHRPLWYNSLAGLIPGSFTHAIFDAISHIKRALPYPTPLTNAINWKTEPSSDRTERLMWVACIEGNTWPQCLELPQ